MKGDQGVKELEVSNKPIDNEDIVIFKDIFTASSGNGFSEDISAKIKALENSFIVVTQPGISPQYYMIKDPTKLYTFNVKITGT